MNNFFSGIVIFANAGLGLADTSGLNMAVAISGLLVLFIANSHKMYIGARDLILDVRKDAKARRERRKNKQNPQKGE